MKQMHNPETYGSTPYLKSAEDGKAVGVIEHALFVIQVTGSVLTQPL